MVIVDLDIFFLIFFSVIFLESGLWWESHPGSLHTRQTLFHWAKCPGSWSPEKWLCSKQPSVRAGSPPEKVRSWLIGDGVSLLISEIRQQDRLLAWESCPSGLCCPVWWFWSLWTCSLSIRDLTGSLSSRPWWAHWDEAILKGSLVVCSLCQVLGVFPWSLEATKIGLKGVLCPSEWWVIYFWLVTNLCSVKSSP